MLRGTSLLLLLPFFLFVFVPTPAAALKCPDGTESHAAKEGEVPGVSAGTQTCGQAGILNGGCDTNPYPFLEQRRGGNVQITPSGGAGSLANGINPALACRLSKLIQAFETKGCSIRISSAYRSASSQAETCKSICGNPGGCGTGCSAPGNSCHQYGLAVDITSNCTAQLRQYLGTKNPAAQGAQQFKLHFPYSGDHIQCIENMVAACSVSTRGCDGSVQINPDLSTIPSASPSSQLSDAIRRAMGQQPPMPPQPPPPPQPTLPAQPTLPTQPTISSEINTSTVANPQITPISDIINNNSNTNTNTKSASSSTSTIDLINEFGSDSVSDSIDIGKAVDIDLNPDTSDAISLDGRKPATILSATGTLAIYQTLSVPQTFTSSDLANSPLSSSVVGENTFLRNVLQTMKNALLYALNYLKPFGGYTPTRDYAE